MERFGKGLFPPGGWTLPLSPLRVISESSGSAPVQARRAAAAVRRVLTGFETALSLARIALEAGDTVRAAQHFCDVANELRADVAVTGQVAARPRPGLPVR